MEEDKNSLANEVASAGYDAAEKPFDFIGTDSKTALVCEANPAIKEIISKTLINMGYHVTEPNSGREALKSMRFHVYDLIIVTENFDMTDAPEGNEVLNYLQNLAAAARRNIFVALLTDNYRTMDNMLAFNKSVNLVINTKNIDDFATIIKRGLDDNQAFYGVFKETLKKLGRV
jgi:CheY-like chemotaxis protein